MEQIDAIVIAGRLCDLLMEELVVIPAYGDVKDQGSHDRHLDNLKELSDYMDILYREGKKLRT